MHEIVEATVRLCREHHGLEVERASARLALLTAVDHLEEALDLDELAVVADALPLGLSMVLRRRSGTVRMQFELDDEKPLRAACEALANVVAGAVGEKLRAHVADVLLGRSPGPGAAPAPVMTADGPVERPTIRVDVTPTLRAAEEQPTTIVPGLRIVGRPHHAA